MMGPDIVMVLLMSASYVSLPVSGYLTNMLSKGGMEQIVQFNVLRGYWHVAYYITIYE